MKKTLLMIDDDQALVGLVRRFFEPEGWAFESARTLEQGLRKGLEIKPSVILLDLRLPDGDSWNLLCRLKNEEALRKASVVMISGIQTRPEDKATGLLLGADDFVAKPLNLNVLSAKLEALLRAARERPVRR